MDTDLSVGGGGVGDGSVEEAPLKLGDLAGELTLQPVGSGGNGGWGVRTEVRLRTTSGTRRLADMLPWGLDIKYLAGLNH